MGGHDLGTLFIISAPSGTGKSTLLTRLTEEDSRICFSVSHTTRAPRLGEVDGTHYNFVQPNIFKQHIEENAFLEWACFADNYYGTSRAPVQENLAKGMDVILEIEVVGAAQVRQKMPNSVSIFIMPPSYHSLKDRLVARGKDSPSVIEKRLSKSRDEMLQAHHYDFLIVNDNLAACYQRLRAVITGCRSRAAINPDMLAKIIATFPKNG